jgi:hypothetical protein
MSASLSEGEEEEGEEFNISEDACGDEDEGSPFGRNSIPFPEKHCTGDTGHIGNCSTLSNIAGLEETSEEEEAQDSRERVDDDVEEMIIRFEDEEEEEDSPVSAYFFDRSILI